MSKKRKVILIPGYAGKDSNNFGVGNNYLEFFSKFGDVRILMPHDEFVEGDLLVLPGGLDISASSYGKNPGYKNTAGDQFKQHFYDKKLNLYVGKMPIFGICLGFQQLCAYFGSTITQNFLFHEQSSSRWATAHKVFSPERVKFGELGSYKIEGLKNCLEVNSHHHQGVIDAELSPQLKPIAYAELNGYDYVEALEKHNKDCFIVEAMEHADLPIAGVQWHPEELYDPISMSMINKLLNNGKD